MAASNCSCGHSANDVMRMTFYFGENLRLLFHSWNISSPGELVGAIIAVFLLAIFYEGLKTLREYLLYLDMKRSASRRRKDCRSTQTDQTQLILTERESTGSAANKGLKYYSLSVTVHLLQSALHVVQTGLGYLLMLVAMTYNGWLFLSVCFGAGVGYLLFAKSRHLMGNFRERNEICH